jgi:hypothetical protein
LDAFDSQFCTELHCYKKTDQDVAKLFLKNKTKQRNFILFRISMKGDKDRSKK